MSILFNCFVLSCITLKHLSWIWCRQYSWIVFRQLNYITVFIAEVHYSQRIDSFFSMEAEALQTKDRSSKFYLMSVASPSPPISWCIMGRCRSVHRSICLHFTLQAESIIKPFLLWYVCFYLVWRQTTVKFKCKNVHSFLLLSKT